MAGDRRADEVGGVGLQETKTSFHTASAEEIKSARVADVYFHRAMAVLRARGAENVPVHAELTYKTSDPE